LTIDASSDVHRVRQRLISGLRNRVMQVLVTGACMLLIVGCGSDIELGHVTGRVTLDGKPVPDARVIFRPEYGRMSQDMTDESGQYELFYTIDSPGALVGRHHVTISTAEPIAPMKSLPELVPAKYNTESTLSYEVVSGENIINLDLTSPETQPDIEATEETLEDGLANDEKPLRGKVDQDTAGADLADDTEKKE